MIKTITRKIGEIWIALLNRLSGKRLIEEKAEVKRLNQQAIALYKKAQQLTAEAEKRFVVIHPYQVEIDGNGNIQDGEKAFLERMYQLSADPAILFLLYVLRESVFKKMVMADSSKNQIFLGMISAIDIIQSEMNRLKMAYLNKVAEEEA